MIDHKHYRLRAAVSQVEDFPERAGAVRPSKSRSKFNRWQKMTIQQAKKIVARSQSVTLGDCAIRIRCNLSGVDCLTGLDRILWISTRAPLYFLKTGGGCGLNGRKRMARRFQALLMSGSPIERAKVDHETVYQYWWLDSRYCGQYRRVEKEAQTYQRDNE